MEQRTMIAAPNDACNTSATPRAKRHLAAVEGPNRTLDRRTSNYLVQYVELGLPPKPDTRPEPKRRLLGYGLKPGPAQLYSALVQLLGDEFDGKKGHYDPHQRVNASYLSQRYGWTYDQVESWTRSLEKPWPCPHCERGHALLRVQRGKRGASHHYSLVRCQDLPDDSCLALDDALPKPRARTGGASPSLEDAKPDTTPDPARELPLPLEDQRVLVINAIARFHRIDLTHDDVIAIATAASGYDTVADYEATTLSSVTASRMLGISVRDAVAGASANSETSPSSTQNATALKVSEKADTFSVPPERNDGSPTDPAALPDDVRTWAQNRILDFARRVEPFTTPRAAKKILDDLLLPAIAAQGKTTAKSLVDEIHRILTDPRIAGSTATQSGPNKPIAMLRNGIADGWIWHTYDHADADASLWNKIWGRMPRKKRDAAVTEIRRHLESREPLDYQRLNNLGIGKAPFVRYAVERVRRELKNEP